MTSLPTPVPAPSGTLGEVVRPGDAAYDELRRVHNGRIDRHPALIVRAGDAAEVAAAIRHARDAGLPLAVRAGGHSIAGHGSVDGGLVVDTRGMKDVVVDPAAMTVTATAGVTWAELDGAAQAQGLAVTGGRVSDTGVVGVTLGSGSGWLERTMGLSSDNLVCARVVTAAGVEVVTSPSRHPDLFWALRGGGGNFGVVTEVTLKAMALGPRVLAGWRAYPFRRVREVLAAYADVMRDAPDELCGGIALGAAPSAPGVPGALRGEPFVGVVVLWAGDLAGAEAGIAPLDALGEPLVDLVRPTLYTDLQRVFDPPSGPATRCYMKVSVLDDLCEPVIETLAGLGDELTPASSILLQPLGGAFGRVRPHDSALGDRGARWATQVLSVWSAEREDAPCIAWTRAAAAELADHGRPSSWPNMVADDDKRRMPVAYAPATLQRLREIKRAWDPDNVFRQNHNVVP